MTRILYTAATPNGTRAAIMLEEVGLPYETRALNLAAGEQLRPEYLTVSPIGKVPALVDDGTTVFGSMAILAYLAETHGILMPTEPAARVAAHNWLAFAASDLGPTGVSLYYFTVRYADAAPVAADHFLREVLRCHAALEQRLGEAPYLAGHDYSVADIAVFPFVAAAAGAHPNFFDARPNLRRWHDAILARPAVRRALAG
jgi:GSH-dependent disulfide-bond oxidoreductase